MQAQKDLKNTLKRPFQPTKNRPDTATTPFNGLGFYARNFVQADDYLVILAASAVGVHGNKVLSGRQSAIIHEFNPALIGMRDIGLYDGTGWRLPPCCCCKIILLRMKELLPCE